MDSIARRFCLAIFVTVLPYGFTCFAQPQDVSSSGSDPASIITNGDFGQWKDDLPVGWEVEIGATNGAKEPLSEIRQIGGPALLMRGDSKTKAWRTVSQAVPAKPGDSLSLRFMARVKDVRREGSQFDNCHVGWMSKNASGKMIGRAIVDLSESTADWKAFEVNYVVPQGAEETTIYAFLSKSGLLGLKGFVITESSSENEASGNLLTNSRFTNWSDGLPDGWQVEVSANNGGQSPESKLIKTAEGLALRGDRNTLAWNSVAQDKSLQPGTTYELSFDAVAKNVRREGRQFDNCYVGVLHFDAAGKRLDMSVEDLSQWSQMKQGSLSFRVPAGATKSTVMVFLSKSGQLTIKSLELHTATPQQPFAELLHGLRQHYSFTELKGIDWADLEQRYRPRVEQAKSQAQFVAAITPMLAALKDMHVWIEGLDGTLIPTYTSGYVANVDRNDLRARLSHVQEFSGIGYVGDSEDIAVVVIEGLPSDGDYTGFIAAIAARRDSAGFIVDLRRNKGGSEIRAAAIAGLFTDQRVPYAKALRRRDGELHASPTRYLEPSRTSTARDSALSPVACLIGPGCVSSGEGMALMFKSIPGATLLGQPTRGASGNPAPITLSNGVKVWFSRWQSLELDGTCIEGRGVTPNRLVDHQTGDDPTLRLGIKWLQTKTAPN
ncbi:MAG: S41 family peptidase [Planctomycetota bacterium]